MMLSCYDSRFLGFVILACDLPWAISVDEFSHTVVIPLVQPYKTAVKIIWSDSNLWLRAMVRRKSTFAGSGTFFTFNE